MIAATLSGPTYAFRPNHDETSIEVFPDLESVIVAMIERYHSRGRTFLSYTTLDGEHHNALIPLFGEDTELTCYEVAGKLDGEPTEEQVMDALTDVHSRIWTWKLTLNRPAMSTMSVLVRPNR